MYSLMKRCCFSAILLITLLLVGCKGDMSTQALTEFKDYGAYFGSNEGCFVLYQNKLNKYWMFNGFLANDYASPDDTYWIYQNLMGLQMGIINDDDVTEEWNQLQLQISTEDLTAIIEELQYGNKDISGPEKRYWQNASLKITPLQQVELLRKLYIQVLPFSESHQSLMKDALFLAQYGTSQLYGITSSFEGNGWFIGFVEKEETAYFFAVRVLDQTGEFAKDIAITILQDEDLL